MLINQNPDQLRLNIMSTQFTIIMVIFSFPFDYWNNFAFIFVELSQNFWKSATKFQGVPSGGSFIASSSVIF